MYIHSFSHIILHHAPSQATRYSSQCYFSFLTRYTWILWLFLLWFHLWGPWHHCEHTAIHPSSSHDLEWQQAQRDKRLEVWLLDWPKQKYSGLIQSNPMSVYIEYISVLFPAVPSPCMFLVQGLNPHHSSIQSHSSDNVRPLTYWATRKLLGCIFLIDPMFILQMTYLGIFLFPQWLRSFLKFWSCPVFSWFTLDRDQGTGVTFLWVTFRKPAE